MQGSNQTEQQNVVFTQIFSNLHEQTRTELLKHRELLLNFIGLVILGGFIVLFQSNVQEKILQRNTVLFLYFISLMLLIMSKYLLALSFRNMLNKINVSVSLVDLKEACTSNLELFYVICAFASFILFLCGSLVGLHALFENCLLLLAAACISSILLAIALVIEFKSKVT